MTKSKTAGVIFLTFSCMFSQFCPNNSKILALVRVNSNNFYALANYFESLPLRLGIMAGARAIKRFKRFDQNCSSYDRLRNI